VTFPVESARVAKGDWNKLKENFSRSATARFSSSSRRSEHGWPKKLEPLCCKSKAGGGQLR